MSAQILWPYIFFHFRRFLNVLLHHESCEAPFNLTLHIKVDLMKNMYS